MHALQRICIYGRSGTRYVGNISEDSLDLIKLFLEGKSRDGVIVLEGVEIMHCSGMVTDGGTQQLITRTEIHLSHVESVNTYAE